MRKLAFALGRRLGKHPAASRIFCIVERVLPLQRLGRSAHCVAFMHPRPTWEPHILIVPTTPFPALMTENLDHGQKAGIVWKMLNLARDVVDTNDADWRMIINGGERQEIGQVHGHLIHADDKLRDASIAITDPAVQGRCWDLLFEWIQRAENSEGNGYSVEFRLLGTGGVSGSFTQSASS